MLSAPGGWIRVPAGRLALLCVTTVVICITSFGTPISFRMVQPHGGAVKAGPARS